MSCVRPHDGPGAYLEKKNLKYFGFQSFYKFFSLHMGEFLSYFDISKPQFLYLLKE